MSSKLIRTLIGSLLVVGIFALVHWNRNLFNAPVSSFADVADWTKLTPEESIFHQQGEGNEQNMKFVSPDGRSEAVFRPGIAGGEPELVTDVTILGTYNFFGPRFAFGIFHGIFDVVPYFLFGNAPADLFNMGRFTVLAR